MSHPSRLNTHARLLGIRLGLGDLNRPQPCMGYANACVCDDCRERQQLAHADTGPRPRQPWEVRSRKAA